MVDEVATTGEYDLELELGNINCLNSTFEVREEDTQRDTPVVLMYSIKFLRHAEE